MTVSLDEANRLADLFPGMARIPGGMEEYRELYPAFRALPESARLGYLSTFDDVLSDGGPLFTVPAFFRYMRDSQMGPWGIRAGVLRGNTPFEQATPAAPVPELGEAPQVVIPIGPEHPDWRRFAEEMAAVATRGGFCPEYDRIARLMGLPTRKTRIVTRITLEVPVEIDRGQNVDDRVLRDAARALLEQNGTVSRANREEVSRNEIVG